MNRATLLLLAVCALLCALWGCTTTLQPGEVWYTYRNPQNNFAVVSIDGRVVGPRLRPGDAGAYPLTVAKPHTVIVAHGTYKPIIGLDYHREEWEADTIDPPFTIRWDGAAWVTPEP